ncbi:MAG TPA: endonuclease VII domain-containing protein [Ktedonobacterales bacterium]|nr:endonuclease VII domain-containing protein [Ktedonobacterales bacterium]
MPQKKIYQDKAARDHAYYERHKQRILAYRKGWYSRNRLQQRLSKFGLTVERYEELLLAQSYKCKICGDPAEQSRDGVLHIDHSHETGEVRGLLCNHCNLGLGHFKDNSDNLQAALAYLLDRRL